MEVPMITKHKILSASLAVTMLSSAACIAGPGSKGKDFDEETFKVKPGSIVDVVGVCTTKNTQSGNTSSVVVFQDGVEVGRDGGDRYSSEYRYTIDKPGTYNLRAVCYNTRADADTCRLKISSKEIKEY